MCLAAAEHVVEHRPLRRLRHHRPVGRRGGRARPGSRRPTRTSTAGSTCATTAPARRSCWSTTPTPRPRWWRRPSPQWFWLEDRSPAPTSGTRCTSGWSPRWAAGRRCCRPAPLHFAYSDGGRDRRGPDDRRLPAGDRRAGRAGHRRRSPWRTSAGTRWPAASSTCERPLHPDAASSSTRGSGWSPTPSATPARSTTAAAPTTCGSSRLEDAAVQQGAAGDPVGAVPRPPQPAARLPRRPPRAGPHRLRRQAAAGPRGRGHAYVTPAGSRDRPARTAPRAAATRSWRRCRTSTATGVLGAWVVEDESAGLGIRESAGLITDDTSPFVPHRIARLKGSYP